MKTPIADFVKKYSNSNAARLHMPGHKGNPHLCCEKFDITEINGADVLYSANGIIKQSQQNVTSLFNSGSTLYSAEGSSLCIRAMLYLLKAYAKNCGKKATVAAARNAHKTFVNTCAVLDVAVDWLLPDNAKNIVSCVITANFLENYLQNAKEKPLAVYITSPDYLGFMADISALSAVCQRHNVLLIVDNAHGAYLKFLPHDCHPITQGADMCCDSAHKTLPVLTGGAYLHVAKTAPSFFAQNAQKALSLFASTSPSYLILQSLDLANEYLSDNFTQRLSHFAQKIEQLKKHLTKIGYTLCGDESLKLTIATKSYGYTGYELYNILLKNNIVCEFADPDFTVMMFSAENSDDEIEKLKMVLSKIPQKKAISDSPPIPTVKIRKLSLNEALYSPQEMLNINDCLGRISACFDAVCPPAIPIVIAGEEIDSNAIECFKYYGIEKTSVIKPY